MWGDPFLHPQIKEIMSYMKKEKLTVGISTNASKLILFDEKDVLSNVHHIWFSMPGFSQESYDRCHGFNFETIKKNITLMSDNFYNVGGLRKRALINIFHMYQYNLLELPGAIEFAKKVNANLWPYAAAFNDSELLGQFVNHTMERSLLEKASKELFLCMYDKRKADMKNNDKGCQQFNNLTLDENCNIVLCCGRSDIKLGNLFDIKSNEVNKMRLSIDKCKECSESKEYLYDVLQLGELLPIRI